MVHHLGARPKPRRPSPARTGSSRAPVASRRCRAWSSSSSPTARSWRCACAASRSSRLPQRTGAHDAGLRREGLLPHRRRRFPGRRDRPERGVVFNGRVAEDFKLSSGTWVSVGTLRLKVVSALAPLVQDAVVTGHDRGEVGVLFFASPAAASLGAAELAERTRARVAGAAQRRRRLSQTPARLVAGRAAECRCRRDHRQGLHQPGRGTAPPCGRGRRALRRYA